MTSTGSGVTTPTFPPGRYGRRRERRAAPRWLGPVLLVAVVLAGLAVAAGYYQRFGAEAYRAQVISSNVPAAPVRMTLRVHKPAGEPARCVVRARAHDGSEVGRATVSVPAGSPDTEQVDVRYTLTVSKRAITAEVRGCGPAK